MISGHQEFFSSNLVGRIIFFPFLPIGFLLHLCCMQFFSFDKRLQEIFFKITHLPHQELNGQPLISLCKKVIHFFLYFSLSPKTEQKIPFSHLSLI